MSNDRLLQTRRELALTHRVDVQDIARYERAGILEPDEAVAGCPLYGKRARDRMALIVRAEELGFQLEQVKAVLNFFGDRKRANPTS